MTLIHAIQTYFVTKIYNTAKKSPLVTILLLGLMKEREMAVMYNQDDSIMSMFLVIALY
jgi:hypothetical protein